MTGCDVALYNRCRFNSGYHDAKSEWARNGRPADIRHELCCGSDWRQSHCDPVYVAGYNWGEVFFLQGIDDNGLSDKAWKMSGLGDTAGEGVYPKRNFSVPTEGDIRKGQFDGREVVFLVDSLVNGYFTILSLEGDTVLRFSADELIAANTRFIRSMRR